MVCDTQQTDTAKSAYHKKKFKKMGIHKIALFGYSAQKFDQSDVGLQYLLKPICHNTSDFMVHTVKILKIGTPEIITIIVLQLEQLDFTVQYCVQKMQTE